MKRSIENISIFAYCAGILASVIYVILSVYVPDHNALGALASVSMDTICIMISIIIIISLVFEKFYIGRTTRLFLLLMLGTVWALFFDFLTWSMDGSLSYGNVTFAFIVCSLCSGSLLAGAFSVYISCYMDDMYNLKAIHFSAKICAFCNLIAFVITIVLALTNNAFTIVDGHYEVGALYDFVMAIPILTLLHMTGMSIRYVKIIGIHDVIAVVTYILTMVIGALIESEFRVGTTYVGLTIASVIIFVMLQNKFIDRVIQTSNTDELTGFYNRHAYVNDTSKVGINQLPDSFVYVSMDVNGLKTTNDTLGHAAGDEMLLGACECMKRCFGPYGKLYRIGGDEFVALINVNSDKLNTVKKSVEDVTSNWKGKNVKKLAISCGYVTKAEADDMTFHKMAVLADKRMYEAKSAYYQKMGIDRRSTN